VEDDREPLDLRRTDPMVIGLKRRTGDNEQGGQFWQLTVFIAPPLGGKR